jgi:hypothetical protein
MAWFFTKAALLTFGGAYAVLLHAEERDTDTRSSFVQGVPRQLPPFCWPKAWPWLNRLQGRPPPVMAARARP